MKREGRHLVPNMKSLIKYDVHKLYDDKQHFFHHIGLVRFLGIPIYTSYKTKNFDVLANLVEAEPRQNQ
jgi:hypothetical protein